MRISDWSSDVCSSDLGRILLVTGLSGAGHTTALKVLEDLGCEAVDNLPLRLMGTLVRQGPAAGRGLAIGVDVRTRDFAVAGFSAEAVALKAAGPGRLRSEERGVGNELVGTMRSRWAQ